MQPAAPIKRDLRLDFFRGLALWFIFIDHIPDNFASWITVRSYGFSDASEIFVFISGYTAAFVYGRVMRSRGFVLASASILRRVWQIYLAHIFLFTIFMAEISHVSRTFDNPLYAEEMNILDFLQTPDVTIVQALLLKFTPVYMDILPLYIALLGLFPLVLWALQRAGIIALAMSTLLYALTWWFDWNVPAYPGGYWYFNPFAWQLLFVFGAWCALEGAERLRALWQSRVAFVLAGLYVLASLIIVLAWRFPGTAGYMPAWLTDMIGSLDKTNLDLVRLTHFIALTVLVVQLVPVDWKGLRWRISRPAIVTGQHSLAIFCIGVVLSFFAHFLIVELSGGIQVQIAISLIGVLVMIGIASMMSWYKRRSAEVG
jgi:hypothetical protein